MTAERARALVERIVGPVRSVADRSWPHGVTAVHRWEAGGEIVWTKAHSQPRKLAQEQRAYEVLVPALAAEGLRVPHLLAVDEPILLLSHLPGEPARADDPAVARQSGAALAIVHRIPLHDADPVPLHEAMRARFERWAPLAAGHLPVAVIAACRAGLDPDFFRGFHRVWCHRDWSARNQVVERGRVGVLDFEHTGPDLWLVDLVRQAEGAWDDPAVRRAFLEGYGPMPDHAADGLARLLWLTELSTVAWSAAHGDAEYEAIGRRTLDRLLAGWRPLG